MSTNTLRNCPSARTLYKRLLRGVVRRSRIHPKVRIPLAAYPTQPPSFIAPGKPVYHDAWQLPSVDGCEVMIHITSMSTNYDPRLDASQQLTPTITDERKGWWEYYECGVYTASDDSTSGYTSIVDADPTILTSYLARKAWIARYAEGVGAPDDSNDEPAWMGEIAGSCYGWYVKGCYASIVGDYLVLDVNVKSCYRNRVRNFCRDLASALKTCAKAGIKVHVTRSEE